MQILLLYYSECSALDSKISNIEMKLAAAKAEQQSLLRGDIASGNLKRKYFMVIGINTAFSSRKRRDSIRATWMPQGELTGPLFVHMLFQL
jgi:hypothetical protein